MSRELEFFFDVGSPASYLAWTQVPGLCRRTGATLRYRPMLLGGVFKATGNASPAAVPAKGRYSGVDMQRFARRYGVTLTMNPHFPVNTILLMRGALAAERAGDLGRYVEAGLKHMWEDGLKMDDPDVFSSAMTDAGLDGQALLESTQDPQVKAALIENTENAVTRGVFGVPTFVIGQEVFWGDDVMDMMIDYLADPKLFAEGDLGRLGVAICRLLVHHFFEYATNRFGYAQRGIRQRGVLEQVSVLLARLGMKKRRVSGHHVVERAAQRVNIRAYVDRCGGPLFGRHVQRGAQHAPGDCLLRGVERPIDQLGQPEVQHLDLAFAGGALDDHQVFGLEIAVHDALAVRRHQSAEQLSR